MTGDRVDASAPLALAFRPKTAYRINTPTPSAMTIKLSWMSLLEAPRFILAGAVSLIAALLLIISLPPDVTPGDSAMLVARHAGIDVFAPLSHNVWGWLAAAFDTLPVGPYGFRWNLFSAICGAACCGMLVLLGARLPALNPQWSLMIISTRAMANLAGVAAGLLLLGSLPFRIASASASPATFELLALLVAIWLLVRYIETKRLSYAAGAAALLSLAASQSPAAIVVAPLFAIALFYRVWRTMQLTPKTAGVLFAALMGPGLLVFIAVATWFGTHPSAAWVGLTSPGKILYQMVLELYLELRIGAPLLTFIMTGVYGLLPLAIILSITSGRRAGTFFVTLLILVLGALLFLNVRIAPFPLIGMHPLIIAVYALAAAWLGYLSAYLIGATQATTLSYYYLRRHPRAARILSAAGLAALALFIVAAGMLSHRQVQVDAAMGVTRLAGAIADQAGDDTWLVVHGELDPLVRIKAQEAGRRPLIISADRIAHRPYQRALAAAMPSPRLASMVESGLAPLLRERMHPDHAPAPRVAILGEPGLLRYIVNTAWPDRILYWSVEPAGLNISDYVEMQRAWWNELPLPDTRHPYQHLETKLRAISARVANDAGVWLQDHNADDPARDAYREAIRIDPANLSARLNLRGMLADDHPDTTALEEEIETLSARLRGRLTLPRIMDLYGTIRHAAAAEAIEQRWGRADADPLDPRLIELFALTDDNAILTSIRRVTKDDPAILLNFARLANGRARPALARLILDTLPDSGPLAKAIRIERAQTAISLGDREAARQILSGIPDREIDDPRILIMLALITIETEPATCDRYLAQLEVFPGRLPDLSLPIARIYEARDNREMAARHLEYLAVRQPLNKDVHRNLIRLHLEDENHAVAYAAARPLLALDTRDPWANAALALHLEQAGDSKAAASARAIALAGDAGMSRFLENTPK